MNPMVDAPSTAMLSSVVSQAMDLDFELPDPEDDSISPFDFNQAIDQAWEICDRFDLQTEIWRGRILRAVRDRERYGGDERGAGFLAWLKEREITKSRAYNLIDLASSADALLEQGSVELESVTHFSKQAFIETAQSPPEVQVLVGDAARDGKRITKNHVKQVAEEWTAVTSDLLPEPIRAKAADNSLPSKYLAPLVKEMEKLPEQHQEAIQAEMSERPDLDTVKDMTLSARYLSRYLESAAQVQTIANGTMDLELALEEALRLDCLNLTADLVHQAAQLENAMAKLHTSWKRLGSLSDRLYVESGASTPHLRQLLDNLGSLAGESLSLPMGDLATGRTIRIQILPEE